MLLLVAVCILNLQYGNSKQYAIPVTKEYSNHLGVVDGIRVVDTEKHRKSVKRLTGKYRSNSSQPLYDYQDYEYVGDLTVGTPPTQFRVIFDTGSADTWLPGVSCQVGGTNKTCNKTLFDPKNSSTFLDKNTTFFIGYGTGSVEGKIGFDDVGLGGIHDDKIVVKNQSIGVVTIADDMINSDITMDGIVGLAFTEMSTMFQKSIFEKAIEEKLVDQPVFTVWMDGEGYDANGTIGGQITFGAFDCDHCECDTTNWIILEFAFYWNIVIDGFGINNKLISQRYGVVVDTGTSYIITPPDVFEQIVKEFGATEKDGEYVLPCNSNVSLSIVVNAVDENTYVIQAKHLLLKPHNSDSCILAIQGADISWDIQFILKDPFIRQFCLVHNVEMQNLGLSKVKV
ncbi:unnamed protein product [Bursaphelenchus okinawaensis]|uniref:Peptidase A1 domain-containing protein n=1 Tax=Bursaphelenchus okinawaensis TaxID=465554 RepID=A0A811KR46_9BILA|nr:unnamed protein product [Bursaphelenchus okinawaensis]CAG9109720.1 unnamed protein product [Bursaphelenchus okinawaensis]